MQHILFDLDGTLIDHFTTIYKSVVHTQQSLGLPESDYATVRQTVGGSVPITLAKLCGEANVAVAEPIFRAHFEQILYDDAFALPGAAWLLQNLKAEGYKLAVFTNKYAHHARQVLEHLGLSPYLDAVIGTGEPGCEYRKPDPMFTMHALEVMDCASEDAVMIGDSPYDLAAAEAGCVPCYLIATGSHSRSELSEYLIEDRIYSDLYAIGENLFHLQPQTEPTT